MKGVLKVLRYLFKTVLILTIFVNTHLYLLGANNNTLFSLNNGLKVFLLEKNKLPMVDICFCVNIGLKNETPENNGIVHLLEHVLYLGGTQEHSSDELIKELRLKGISFNAHTDNDYMTFELSLPKENMEWSLKFLKDKIFDINFTKMDVLKEKKAIIKEIHQLMDDPLEVCTYEVLKRLFKNHKYKNQVFGSIDTLEKIKTKEIELLFKKYFYPGNCSIAIIGDFKIDKIRELIKKKFSELKNISKKNDQISLPEQLDDNIYMERKMDVEKIYISFGFLAPHGNHKNSLVFDLLTRILGKSKYPILNRVLWRKGKRIADRVFTRYIPMRYGGAFLVYLIVDSDDIEFAEKELLKTIKHSWLIDYSEENLPFRLRGNRLDYLDIAKRSRELNLERNKEKSSNIAWVYARYLLDSVKADKLEIVKKVKEISSSDIKKTASEYLSKSKYVKIKILPLKNED